MNIPLDKNNLEEIEGSKNELQTIQKILRITLGRDNEKVSIMSWNHDDDDDGNEVNDSICKSG